MSVQVHSLTLTDEVYYLANNLLHVIRQPDPGWTIAVLEITARNDRSDKLQLDINGEAFQLLDEHSNTYRPINPFNMHGEFVQLARNVPTNQPYYYCNPAPPQRIEFVWGPIDLERTFGIRGLALFDVPRGLEYSELRWLAVEALSVPFKGAFEGASEHWGR